VFFFHNKLINNTFYYDLLAKRTKRCTAMHVYHCWNSLLCRLPKAVGKGPKTGGKGFADCFTRGSRQRTRGKEFVGKEQSLSGLDQSLMAVMMSHLIVKRSSLRAPDSCRSFHLMKSSNPIEPLGDDPTGLLDGYRQKTHSSLDRL